MNFCLERHKLSLILLMLIIFYGTLDVTGRSSSLYLNNDIPANSYFPLHRILPPDLWWWCLQGPVLVDCMYWKCYFPFPGAAGWVPVCSTSNLFFQQPPLLWELSWAELEEANLPKPASQIQPRQYLFIAVSAGNTSAKRWLFCFHVLPFYCSVKTS